MSAQRWWQAVPLTGKPEQEAEVVSIPNRAVNDVYRRILDKRGKAAAIDGQIGHAIEAFEDHRKQVEELVERLHRDKQKLLKDMRDDQDIWRRMSVDLGVDVVWPVEETDAQIEQEE
jgi:hypothetical protein